MSSNQIFKDTEFGKIPKDWKVVEIKEICKVKRGASPRPIGDPSYFSDTGRGWIRISDVTDARKYLRKTSQYLSKKGEDKSVKVNPGDLIMSICATIGKPIILDMEACIHDGFVWFSELSSDVDVECLFYVLQKNEVTFSSKRQIGTQGNINTSLVGMTNILLPPFPEQKKIAEILSTVDQGIERVDEVIDKTQKLKKGFMQKLLTKGIGHKEFKDTEIGKIPKKWEIVKILGLGKITTGKTPSTSNSAYWNGTIPFITPADVRKEKYVYETERHVTSQGAQEIGFTLPADTVLVVCIGSTIGKTGLTYMESVTNQQINSIVCNEDTNKDYVYYATTFRADLLRSFSGVAAVPIIKKSLFEQFKLPLPPVHEQKKIADILGAIDERLELLRKRKERLERVKKGLMDVLLTGRKRVRLEA